MESVSEQTFVGLDVHRKSVYATAFDAAGSLVSQQRFGASDAELIDYLGQLPGQKRVVLEACTLWEHFYDAARVSGATVILSNPYRTRLIAEASLKTDKLDSEALATLLRLNSVPELVRPACRGPGTPQPRSGASVLSTEGGVDQESRLQRAPSSRHRI